MRDVAGSCWRIEAGKNKDRGMTFSEQGPGGVIAVQNDPHLSIAPVGECQDGMYGATSANAINSVGE